MPEDTWERVQLWIDEIRGSQDGALFTRIRRFDDVTDERITDQSHLLYFRDTPTRKWH